MRFTEYYKFPQWESEDVTTWKGQLNDTFDKLDKILHRLSNKTYATPEDITRLEELIKQLQESGEGTSSTVEQLKTLLGEFNDKLDKYQENTDKQICDLNKLLNSYSLELHSLTARVELLEKEVSRIGSDLIKQYFPCMDGTTVPEQNTEGSEDDERGDDSNTN